MEAKSKESNKPSVQKRKKATYKQIMDLLEKQDHRCALTGWFLTPDNAELDHKLPRSKGGTDEIENLQWVINFVNKAKGRMSNDEFIAMCKDVSIRN